MAGQQFFDVLAMGSIGTKGPTNVVRIAADAAGNLKTSVKGAAYAPLGGLGPAQVVTVPNSNAVQVNALELDTTLSTATAGAEVSRLVVKLLKAGAAANYYTFDPDTFTMLSAAGKIAFNNGQVTVGTDVSLVNLNLIANGDVVTGAAGALATNTTVGFLQIPTCAGTPTGTVARLVTGKACLVYDSTNFKIGVSLGGGVWKQTAALI